MDNQRFLLWAGFALVLFMLYQAWLEDYHVRPAPAEGAPASSAGPAADQLPDIDPLPATGTAEAPPPLPGEDAPAAAGETISISTDVLELRVDTRGGALVYAALPRYPIEKNRPNEPVVLLDTTSDYFVIQGGLRAAGGGDEPNHRVQWQAAQPAYRLRDGEQTLEVVLTWAGQGVTATRSYRLERGSYRIEIETQLVNQGPDPWRGADYVQLVRANRDIDRSFASVESYSYRGPAVFDGERYEKLDAGDLQDGPWRVTAQEGWLALIQHHFLAAAVPPADNSYQLEAMLLNSNRFLLRAIGPTREVAPGASAAFEQTVFVGPKLQKQLAAIGKKLPLTVDYGFTSIIAQPLFWVLDKIHSVVGNWGWAIILLTLLIKIVFYKLAETSGRSMAKMRKLQPRMKALQERYKDDRQKLSQAMMALYKEEKANPAAGCLPLLVQMPVFFALYWALIESVELRQAPWILWINDLSSRDPYFILPVLMGISMFAMQKLNPQPTDPVQAKVMLAMPLMMGAFMAFFPSGLVLYWLVNNLLSIAQQWRINKVVEAER